VSADPKRPLLSLPPFDTPATEEAWWMETGRLAELGLLTAEMVHELRQPLFSIKSLVAMMRRDDPDHPHLVVLEQQVAHLDSLVGRYASNGRRRRGQPEPMDLWATIHTTAQTLQARARARQRLLHASKSGPARAILADPVGVRQIAGNLIGNALDAARAEVLVVVEDTWLIVHDDGPGVPPDVAQRIFDPFFSTKPPERGTGLGLAIARRLVEESGARLEWDSSATGTEFRVCFAPLRSMAS